MLIIDPMHNLFLGTAKDMVHKIWIENGYLDTNKLGIIEQRLSEINIPSTVSFGRLPLSMDPCTKLTAEQWKNWVNYFSIYCLFDLLPTDHLECWRHFVLACRLLCKPVVMQADIVVADTLLLHFCRRFVQLHGRDLVTPNIHMHGHLAECVRDYSPLSSFWLFPFERYNGLLEGTPTNNRSIEPQIMQRFLYDIHNLSLLEYNDMSSSCFSNVVVNRAQMFQSTSSFKKNCTNSTMSTATGLTVIPASKHTICVLSSHELSVVRQVMNYQL